MFARETDAYRPLPAGGQYGKRTDLAHLPAAIVPQESPDDEEWCNR